MARASILGLYNYDPDIFAELSFPEGIDKATAISTIIFQNAELGLLYTDPETLKTAIGAWSYASQYTWEKYARILSLEYNPIWNKDGTITETEEIGRERSSSGTGENKVSAFNETTYQNRVKDETETEASESETREYTRVEQGNIGVMSTQSMIREEEQIAKFNVYDEISKDFKNRFCVMVY